MAGFRRIFGDSASIWFVATGTAANTLAIAALTQPWQQVLCHVHSHFNDDESTAPERITHCRTVQIRTDSSKLEPADIERAARDLGFKPRYDLFEVLEGKNEAHRGIPRGS